MPNVYHKPRPLFKSPDLYRDIQIFIFTFIFTCIFTWMTSEHLKHKTEIIIISSKTCYSNSLPVSDVDNSSPQALKLKNWKQSFTCLFHPLHQFIGNFYQLCIQNISSSNPFHFLHLQHSGPSQHHIVPQLLSFLILSLCFHTCHV